MKRAAPPSDLAYCRRVLPLVSRTFALNTRLLRGRLGTAVRNAYLLCRAADALEDSWNASDGASDGASEGPRTASEVRARFGDFLRALDGSNEACSDLIRKAAPRSEGRPDLELVTHLDALLRVLDGLPEMDRAAVSTCVKTLAGGMAEFAARAAERPAQAPYLDSEDELDHYCWVVAGCVGVMLTELYANEYRADNLELQKRRLQLAPVVGEALQLTNILLDWPSDLRRGRCYVPADWVAEEGLTPADLVDRDRPEVRRLAERLEKKARASLARVPDYVDLIPVPHVRYRLFCLWPALWAQRSLRYARRDPEFPWGPRRPKLPRGQIWEAAVESLFFSHHAPTLRRMYAASG